MSLHGWVMVLGFRTPSPAIMRSSRWKENEPPCGACWSSAESRWTPCRQMRPILPIAVFAVIYVYVVVDAAAGVQKWSFTTYNAVS